MKKCMVWIFLITFIASNYFPSFIVMANELEPLQEDQEIVEESEKIEKLDKEEGLELEEQNEVQEVIENESIIKSRDSEASIFYQVHVQKIGWQKEVENGATAGTVSQSLRMEALKIRLQSDIDGNIVYQTHIQNIGWQNEVENGTVSGTTGKSLRIEAIRIHLTGDIANYYDVYYRTHVEKFGWLGWAKNGESSGSAGYGYRMEGIEIKLVKKEDSYLEDRNTAYMEHEPVLTYRTHVQKIGWQKYVENGNISGTTGKSLRIEALNINLSNTFDKGTIEYQTHVATIGWQGWKKNNELSGTTGKSLQVEAIRIRLTGKLEELYDIYYRVHSEKFGWLGWTKNGKEAGSAGYGYRMEAIQIKLVKKGSENLENNINAYMEHEPVLTYRTHVQKIGWQNYVKDGTVSGTTGKNLHIEALNINLSNTFDKGTIEYQTHVATIGWQDWKKSNELSGTTGKSLQVEAIRIRLTGKLEELYDIYYRVHIEKYGWLDWAKNGESAGSTSIGYRMEAIQIKLVKKGESAPGLTEKPFITGAFKEENGYTYYYRDGIMLKDWDIIDGKKYFFNSLGHLIASDAKFIIDVSEHQGEINWDKVKKEGKVDGVILRLGFASSTYDKQFLNNLKEVKRLGIPYGIYHFSYAENQNEAKLEAEFVLNAIRTYDIKPTLGIYYDIENWKINGVAHNISKSAYDQIIPTFINTVKTSGYKTTVYTGLLYSEERLNPEMLQYVDWIAQYNHFCQYKKSYIMWQYGAEYVDGIGNVDANVMSNHFA